MKCPACNHTESKVIDSRVSGEGASIRRRRECLECTKRFTTYEYIEQVPLMVVKRDGRRQPFDRKRIIAGLIKACEKRPVSIDKMEEITLEIERTVQKDYDREVDSKILGELIMEKLASLDEVAYVRFASVYRQFRDVNQFMDELKGMLDKKRQDQVIVLKEKEGDRQFPIVIGFLEASSIKMKLSGVETPRPMTHDLLVDTIAELGAKFHRLIIDKMEDNTFHAKLELKMRNGKTKLVDSRPSDGIALAVRTDTDIYVEEEVLKKAEIFKA